MKTFECCVYHSKVGNFNGSFESRTFIYALTHTQTHTQIHTPFADLMCMATSPLANRLYNINRNVIV